MDAVKSFFSKYHAVPATTAGPTWGEASDDALLGWLRDDSGLLAIDRLSPSERAAVSARVDAVARELWTRVVRLADECRTKPNDWPGRKRVGVLLAELAMNGHRLTLTVK